MSFKTPRVVRPRQRTENPGDVIIVNNERLKIFSQYGDDEQ